jgi:hypothetical protein
VARRSRQGLGVGLVFDAVLQENLESAGQGYGVSYGEGSEVVAWFGVTRSITHGGGCFGMGHVAITSATCDRQVCVGCMSVTASTCSRIIRAAVHDVACIVCRLAIFKKDAAGLQLRD